MNEYIEKWILKALEDLKLISHELSFPPEEVVTGAVCFHSQQAVEKLLKAYLILENIDFGKTHDLKYLLNLCIKQDKDFKKVKVGDLTFYAVEVRYPDEFYIPTIEEAKECSEIAAKIKEFVFFKLAR